MTQTEALGARVRMPGKYIVTFAAAALAIVFGATSLLKDFVYAPPIDLTGDAGGERAKVTRENMVELDEFLVDLAPDRSGRVAYLKLSAAIALAPGSGPRAIERVREIEPQIAERIVFMLRGLAPDDFDGEGAMNRVKAEMLRRVNIVLAPDVADNIVISELVIQ